MKDLFSGLARHVDSKALDRLALLATAVLVVLLARSAASLTWALIPEPAQALPPPAQVATAAAQRPDYQRIAALHLFGQAQADTRAAMDAPATRLNLTLKGVLYNPDERYARAFISAPGQEDDQYKVGDQVPGGASISQIHPDRVILLRNGQFETLPLLSDLLDLSAGAPPAASTSSLPDNSGNVLSEYRRQIIESPETAGQFIQAEPVNRAGGGIVGFRVGPGADASMFQLAGLEAGDIVTQINGVQLNTMDKGFEAIEQIAASNQITLKVLRNGQEMTLHLQLQE